MKIYGQPFPKTHTMEYISLKERLLRMLSICLNDSNGWCISSKFGEPITENERVMSTLVVGI